MPFTQVNNLKACRYIFTALFVFCLIAAVSISKSIYIDTSLADITPKSSNPALTEQAIQTLSQSIQKRIILLISSNNEDAVYDAQDELTKQLQKINSITLQVSHDELTERFIEELKPYRFSLLTAVQLNKLINKSAEQIAQTSKASLYDLSSTARVYDFKDDPLGWHSDTLLNLLSDNLVGTDSDEQSAVFHAIVPISINQGALNIDAQAQLSKELENAISQTLSTYPINIDRSGIFFFANHTAKSSKQDITFISSFSSIGIVLLLLLVFRSFRALLLPVISIAIGVGFAFVCTHLFYGSVHILTIVFGASLIGIVVDYSLHYFYHQASDHQHDQTGLLYKALTFSLMTSIIGYTALSFSSLEALQKVATFSCLGLFMAWLSVICLGGLGLKKPLTIHRTIFTSIVQNTRIFIDKIPQAVWVVAVLIILSTASFIFTQTSPFNDNPKIFFTTPEQLLRSEQKVASVANDYEPGRYIIVSGETQSVVYQRHALLMSLIEKSTTLDKSQFTTLINWVPDLNDQENNYHLQAKLYLDKGNELSAANLLRQSLDQTRSEVLEQDYLNAVNIKLTPDKIIALFGDALPPLWFTSPEGIVNFVLIKKGVNADSLHRALNNVNGVQYINSLERTETELSAQRKSATQLLFLAYFLIGILILIYYRSLSALSLLIVPVCSSAMVLVASLIFSFDLNLFHVMALFLVLGFGMDYTIFSKEMVEQQDVTLEAILLSACTSLLSFGLLSLSSIPVVANFGITLLIGNIFNLCGAFIYARAQPLS